MVKLKFVMEPFDFDNASNVIGTFHLEDDIEDKLFSDVIDELEFGTFGDDDYELDFVGENDVNIVIRHRIGYELEHIIKLILGQEEDDD